MDGKKYLAINMKENKITVRFSDDELKEIKKRATTRNIKVATLIRESTINAITNNELLSEKEELKQFIIETVEEASNKKLGRIISLLFRATSHIDVVKEQNNLLYYSLNNVPNDKEHYLTYPKWSHPITELAEEKVRNKMKKILLMLILVRKGTKM